MICLNNKMHFLMVHVDMKEVTTVAKYKTVTKLKSRRLRKKKGGGVYKDKKAVTASYPKDP